MTRISRFAAALVGLALLAPASEATAQQQGGGGVLKDTFGDWEVRCVEGTQNCAMTQVGKTGKGENALHVSIERIAGLKDEGGRAVPAAITVLTPLGVLIPYGVRLKIDAENIGALPLSVCTPSGCVVQQPMLDEGVNKMKGGNTANFTFAMPRAGEIPVAISLSGFTKAYNSLQPISR